jgi:hypothetical protein
MRAARRWEPRGGKSNSFFAKTRDDRFIVKQLSPAERRSFQELAPAYFGHLARAMRGGRPTCLAKIMGVYTVRARPRLKLLETDLLHADMAVSPLPCKLQAAHGCLAASN